jgi:hypothetical protein
VQSLAGLAASDECGGERPVGIPRTRLREVRRVESVAVADEFPLGDVVFDERAHDVVARRKDEVGTGVFGFLLGQSLRVRVMGVTNGHREAELGGGA